MKILKSFAAGSWFEASDDISEVYNPSTEEVLAGVSSSGLDFGEVLSHTRDVGGPALRALTYGERADILKAMTDALHAQRDALIEASVIATGTTRKDAKFDVDGATAVLHYYSKLGAGLGSRRVLTDGEGVKLGRSARFWGQHVRVPLRGTAVLINAFNFPLWNFAEKAAAALLAGMPIIVKPASSTAYVCEQGFEALVKAKTFPEGTAALVCGSPGDLLSRLGEQDVVTFTGSSGTAQKIKSAVMAGHVRTNIEADSLNAAVLAPDVETGSETWNIFLQDVRREMTQKTGQKCTAVRRVFVPADRADEVQEALRELLEDTVTGNPADSSVTMGPLATASQLEDTIEGTRALAQESDMVFGTGKRVDGVGAESGKGYFFAPTLLRAESAKAQAAHQREVFGPVASLLTYSGDAEEAAKEVARGGGSLVTSVYSDDDQFTGAFLLEGGSASGRLYLGSEKMASQAFGSGLVLPQSMHGGPGRAGGGEEMGGLSALNLYTQRLALQGGKRMILNIAGITDEE